MSEKCEHGVSMGVGDGSGRLFIFGDYESIKATQRIVLDRDELKRKLAIAERALEAIESDCEAGWEEQGQCDPKCKGCIATLALDEIGAEGSA